MFGYWAMEEPPELVTTSQETEFYHPNMFYFFLLPAAAMFSLAEGGRAPSELKGNLCSARASKDIGVIL